MGARQVFLFDLDGVLVAETGYRLAVQATFRDFMRQWGWNLPAPDQPLMALYESHGIGSEWDMLPLMLLAVWEGWAAQHGPPPEDAGARALPPPPPPDYHTPLRRLAPHLRSGAYPADVAWERQQDPATAAFPHVGTAALARRLLTHSRDVRRNPVTRRFQERVLGSQAFQATYGLPAAEETASLLRAHDRGLLAPAARAWLQKAMAQGALAAAAYTARPSHPPREIGPLPGYAPEAEMGLAAAGLPHLPHIAHGHLDYVRRRCGLPAEQALLKPAPFHALAALFAALEGHEWPALQRAARWLKGDPAALHGLPRLRVYGFEDNISGLQGFRAAADVLRAAGVEVALHFVGIAAEENKKAALQTAGATVFPNINDALRAIAPGIAD